MEARFIILHPDDPGEILSATALIRCLKTQVEESQVFSVVKESCRWLLESNPYLDEIFCYKENPDELLEQLKDFLPDYLIDLDGGRHVRRFKKRLKVLDFTINRRKIGDQWFQRAFETLSLFDVQNDLAGPQFDTSEVYRDLLPGNFLGRYLVLSLDSTAATRALSEEQIIELAVMIEKPIVVMGSVADRNLADRIGQSTGCAVFPTCGDFTRSEMASVLSHSNGAVIFDPVWAEAGKSMGIECIGIPGSINAESLKNMALQARSLFKSNP